MTTSGLAVTAARRRGGHTRIGKAVWRPIPTSKRQAEEEEETTSSGAPTTATGPLVDTSSEDCHSDRELVAAPCVYSREFLLLAAQGLGEGGSGAALGFRTRSFSVDKGFAVLCPRSSVASTTALASTLEAAKEVVEEPPRQAFRSLGQLRTEFWQRTGGSCVGAAAGSQDEARPLFRSLAELCQEFKRRENTLSTTTTTEERTEPEVQVAFRSLEALHEAFQEAKASRAQAQIMRPLGELKQEFHQRRAATATVAAPLLADDAKVPATSSSMRRDAPVFVPRVSKEDEEPWPMRSLAALMAEHRQKQAPTAASEEQDSSEPRPMRPLATLVKEHRRKQADLVASSSATTTMRPMAELVAIFRGSNRGRCASSASEALVDIGLPPGLEHFAPPALLVA